MMRLTRRGEYAIRGMVYLAQQEPGEITLVSRIADQTEAPVSFLAKIFRDFSRAGLTRSFRGTGGGFSLARLPSEITLLEVVELVEGPIRPNRCSQGEGSCERGGACGIRRVWGQVQQGVEDTLAGVSLEELAKETVFSEPVNKIAPAYDM